MSSGHNLDTDPKEAPEKVARKALANPKVQAALKRPIKISREYDIPYLAGYSEDGSTIYIDRHMPRIIKVAKRTLAVTPYLIIHERTEKALMDALGMKYIPAHRIANWREHDALEKQHPEIPNSLYEHALIPFIKADRKEALKKLPPDYDLTPFKDSHDTVLLKHIEGKIDAPSVKAPGSVGLREPRQAGKAGESR